MPLTLFICGRSRAADPTSLLNGVPPTNEDLIKRQVGGRFHPDTVGQDLAFAHGLAE